MADTLLVRLFRDAQDMFLAAVDHVPAPGRGGPLGKLSAPGRVVAHVAFLQDAWITRFCAGEPGDPWTLRWLEAQQASPDREVAPPLDEAREAFVRIAECAGSWVRDASRETLEGRADLTGTAYADVPTARTYLVARSIAHLYVHAGELTVAASLVGAGDLRLPGPLLRSGQPTEADDWTVPVVAALVRDAYVELHRAADVASTPAVTGAVERLNPVSWIVPHAVRREDAIWNVAAAGGRPHPWLADEFASAEPGTALPWDAVRQTAREVTEASSRWLETVQSADGTRTILRGDRESGIGGELARSACHVFGHASEVLAIASLYGAADLDMPGELAHVARVTEPA